MCAVLAHGAHPNAIGHLNITNLDGSKELGDWFSRRLGLNSTARNGNLLRREEGHAFGSNIGNWPGTFGLLLGGWCPGTRDGDAVVRVRDVRVRDALCEIGSHALDVKYKLDRISHKTV